MKIIVSVKQVAARDSPLRVNGAGTWLDESDLSYEMNEPDAYALEEALQLKEKLGGEVIVMCAGPARATQTIREALAKGADRAIHIEIAEEGVLDALATARLLAAAAGPESPDFVLTGLQSDDLGYGQTGVVLAELLGYAHATIVMEVEPQDKTVRVKRELEDGWFQNVVLPLPVVLTIQSGIKKLRYATLMGIKKAKTKEVKTVSARELGADLASQVEMDRVYLPARSKQTQILSGDRQAGGASVGREVEIRGAGLMSVLAILEQRGGKWNRVSFEALTAAERIAQALGVRVAAVVLGSAIESLTREAAGYPVEKIFAADHALLADYTADGYTAALEQIVQSVRPEAIVFPHTYQVRDYGPKLATRFGKAFVSDVVDVKTENGALRLVRQLFQGKLSADVHPAGEPQFISVQAGAFRGGQPSAGARPIEQFSITARTRADSRQAGGALSRSAALGRPGRR